MRKITTYGCDYCDFTNEDPDKVYAHMDMFHSHPIADINRQVFYTASVDLGSDDDFGAFGQLWDNHEFGYFVKHTAPSRELAILFLRAHLKMLQPHVHGQCRTPGCDCDNHHCKDIREYIQGFLTALDWYEDPSTMPPREQITYENYGFLEYTLNWESFDEGELSVHYAGNSNGSINIRRV